MNAFLKLFILVVILLSASFLFSSKAHASYICFGGITNCFAGSTGLCEGTGSSWSDIPMQNCIDRGMPPPPNVCYGASGNWQFSYYVCQIRVDPNDITGCSYETVPNNYTCSAADACEGGSGGGTGYSAAGHVVAGHCSPGSYVEGNPGSACTSYGYYKQCCSAGLVNPPTYCSGGGCPAGEITAAFDTTCSDPTPPPGPPTNFTTVSNAYCSSGSISIDFSFSPGSGATYNQVRYSSGSPSLGTTVNLPSSPYTINGFSPNQRLYFNIYSCNSVGCTADPNGYYYIDIGDLCGGGAVPPTPTPTSVPGCSPTCASAGYNCGSLSTSCGTISCGSCTAPQTCGGGGTPGVCGGGSGGGTCPQICQASSLLGTPCGSGRTWAPMGGSCTGGAGISCQYCPSGPPACVPTTSCAAQGRTCGSLWNGCASVSCGSCGFPTTCSAFGTCVMPPPTPTPIPRVSIYGHFIDKTGSSMTLNVGQSATINSLPPQSQDVSNFQSTNLVGGTYTVTAAVPSTYTVSSVTCKNCTISNLATAAYANTNSVSVTLSLNNDFAHVYFRYALKTCSLTFSGNVIQDPATTDCSSLAALGGTPYSGFGQVSAFNGDTPPASQVTISGGSYSGLTYAPVCSTPAYLTLSGVLYPVIGVCDGTTYKAQTGYTFAYTNAAPGDPPNRNVTWLLTTQGPWFQVNAGDVRFPNLTNKIPKGKDASVTGGSLFASSTGNVLLGSGNFPLTNNWQVNQEYSYNSDFEHGLGSMSYSFYLSRAKQRNLLPSTNNISSPANLSSLSSGIYQTDGDLDITAPTGIDDATNGKHIVLLVGGTARINGPISVPAGHKNLFVLAAKTSIVFNQAVGSAASAAPTPTNVDGYYTSEGSIIIDGKNNCASGADLRLNVGGALIANSLYPFARLGTGKVLVNRNICSDNPNFPTYYVAPRPDFLLQLTDFYKISYKTYKEVNP